MSGTVERLLREASVIRRPRIGPHGSAFGAVPSPEEILGAREYLRAVLSGIRSEEVVRRAMEIIQRVEESGAGGPPDLATNYKKYRYGIVE